MTKAHSPISWVNEPSTDTPINASNLNQMDNTIGVLDDRIITLDSNKATKTEVSTLISSITFDEDTGIFTFTRKNGSTFTIDTKLEKLAINFSYDETNERLVITLIDGTVQYVDISSLIRLQEFVDSDTIAFTVTSKSVTANIKANSITDEMLESGYLGQITTQAETATENATISISYAVGGTGSREGEDTDNAKYYSQVASNLISDANATLVEANKTLEEVNKKVVDTTFTVNVDTGNLEYESPNYNFTVDESTGNLNWEVAE